MGQSYMGRRLVVWQGMDVTQKTRHHEPRGRRAIWASKSPRRAAIWCPKGSGRSSFAKSIFSLI